MKIELSILLGVMDKFAKQSISKTSYTWFSKVVIGVFVLGGLYLILYDWWKTRGIDKKEYYRPFKEDDALGGHPTLGKYFNKESSGPTGTFMSDDQLESEMSKLAEDMGAEEQETQEEESNNTESEKVSDGIVDKAKDTAKEVLDSGGKTAEELAKSVIKNLFDD